MRKKRDEMNTTAWTVGRRPSLARWLCAFALLLGMGAAMAQQQDDLPGRVGRVADLGGELFLAPEDRPDDWATIGLNYPITNGDNLWARNDGRAEIDFGGGQLRLAGGANLHISRLDDRQFALFVAQGRASVRVRVLEPSEIARVDTPNAQIAIVRPGLYRVDVSEDRQHTHVAVREGEVNVATGGGVQQVLPGQSADIDGLDAQYATVQNGIGTDGFDTWVASRDHYYESARANAGYVSPQMVGAADLAQYGTWSQMPDYGPVWYPNDVPVDWAPYRNGYWVDVGGWGPTWVDYAPWGYAPFHYGRWAYVRGRWGWCPGVYVARPRWAPAFVAWTGGAGWAVSVGGPVYGWVPLAWGEPFRPWWGHCSYGCWERYNRPYSVNVAVWRPNSPAPTHYRNWDAPNGVTAVSRTAFVSRQPVQQNLVHVPRETVARAPFQSAPPPARIESARAQRPVSAPPAAQAFQPPRSRMTTTSTPSTLNRGSTQPDANFSRSRTPTQAPAQPSQPAMRATPSQPPSVAQPTSRQPMSQSTPSPQPQAMPREAQQFQQPQQNPNAMRSRQPSQYSQPQAAQPPHQQPMRATPPPVSQPVPPPTPQRATPQPLPQPRVAPQSVPQSAPQPHVAPQPAPQPRAVPQAQSQSRAAPEHREPQQTPDNSGGGGGSDSQRRSR